jgi:hypothetical protein
MTNPCVRGTYTGTINLFTNLRSVTGERPLHALPVLPGATGIIQCYSDTVNVDLHTLLHVQPPTLCAPTLPHLQPHKPCHPKTISP